MRNTGIVLEIEARHLDGKQRSRHAVWCVSSLNSIRSHTLTWWISGCLLLLVNAVTAADSIAVDSIAQSKSLNTKSVPQPTYELPQTMEIIVQLETKVAQALHEDLPHQSLPSAALSLINTLEHYDAEIRPQHPRSSDPELLTFFSVTGVTGEDAEALRQALSELEAVKAAYTKPAPAMP
jgi:hypothetical protein